VGILCHRIVQNVNLCYVISPLRFVILRYALFFQSTKTSNLPPTMAVPGRIHPSSCKSHGILIRNPDKKGTTQGVVILTGSTSKVSVPHRHSEESYRFQHGDSPEERFKKQAQLKTQT
jgi:hypothetical protein